MVRAKRAQGRPARAVIPIVVIVLVAGIAVAAAVWRLQAGTSTAGTTTQTSPQATTGEPVGGQPTVSASDLPSSASPSASSATPTATRTDSAAAAAALKACQSTVAEGEAVVAAAKQGVGHWAEHVQAQTSFNAKDIDEAQMKAIFARTRLAGPADLTAYDKAVKADSGTSSSCAARQDAGAQTVAALTSCRQRLAAVEPVVAAGKNGMADWKSHQAAMYRSHHQHVDDAQGIWDRAWAAAPPNIKAFQAALKTYEADTSTC